MSLEEYGNEVLRTGRRMHIVTMDDRLVGLMNVASAEQGGARRMEYELGSGGDGAARQNHLASPEESLQRLLERLLAADVNQMPVVSHGEDGSAAHRWHRHARRHFARHPNAQRTWRRLRQSLTPRPAAL